MRRSLSGYQSNGRAWLTWPVDGARCHAHASVGMRTVHCRVQSILGPGLRPEACPRKRGHGTALPLVQIDCGQTRASGSAYSPGVDGMKKDTVSRTVEPSPGGPVARVVTEALVR